MTAKKINAREEFVAILEKLRGHRTIGAFADSLDYSQAQVSLILNGDRKPGKKFVRDLIRVYGRQLEQLGIAEGSVKLLRELIDNPALEDAYNGGKPVGMVLKTSDLGRVPIAGRSSLGRFVEAIENDGRPPNEKKLTEPWRDAAEIASDAAFVVIAEGESMSPTIGDGDEVLIDPGAQLAPNAKPRPQIAWVWLDGKSTIKRYRKIGETLVLSADNPDRDRYPDREITPDEWDAGHGIAYRVLLSRSNRRH